MRKIKFIAILLIFTSISACSHKDVNKYWHDYQGESELWEAYYHEKSVVTFWTEDGTLQHDSSTDATFTVVYKNDIYELAKVQQLEMGYEAGSTGSSMRENYDEGGPDRRAFTITSSGGLLASEPETITAYVRIDDHTETIELSRK